MNISTASKQAINNVVVVRFSLRLSDKWTQIVYGEEANRLIWLRARKRLLDLSLTRSLHCQSVQPSKVFILLDSADEKTLPKDCFDQIYSPLYVHQSMYLNGSYLNEMQSILEADGISGHLAISRIDSDDIVSQDYLLAINRMIRKLTTDRCWLVATDGFRSDFTKTQRVFYRCSPFLTLWTKRFNDNVYSINHELVTNEDHVSVEDDKGLWMQVIHSGNVGNAFRLDTVSTHEYYIKKPDDRKMFALESDSFDSNWFCDWSGFKRVPDFSPFMSR